MDPLLWQGSEEVSYRNHFESIWMHDMIFLSNVRVNIMK